MQNNQGLAVRVIGFGLSPSLAFIFSRSFLLRTAPHFLNAWNRLWISIRETNCTINWIENYTVDSAIHPLNNWGQVLFHSFSFHCSFALH